MIQNIHLSRFFIALSLLFLAPEVALAGDEHAHDHHEHDEPGHDHGDSHEEEGKVEISDTTLKDHGVTIAEAAPAILQYRLALNGRLVANEDRIAHVMPRFSGTIREVRKSVGDRVERGDLLAVLESNQNLQSIELRSPLNGVVIQRHATIGEVIAENNEAFVIGDLSELWADFFVFSPDFSKVKAGQTVNIYLPDQQTPIVSTLRVVSSVVDQVTQSKFVRAVISNESSALYPGLFVRGEVLLGTERVSLAVRSDAIQLLGGKSVVFVQHDGKLEPTPVTLGKEDHQFREILSGIKPGSKYAFGNTFILKAEAGKGAAEHEH